jgi:hypothetical protein
MSESITTCVLRVDGGSSFVGVNTFGVVGVRVIDVSGVVGVFDMEFWSSLCREALLLCSLLGCIVAILCISYIWRIVKEIGCALVMYTGLGGVSWRSMETGFCSTQDMAY